jgi:hypothetical protein
MIPKPPRSLLFRLVGGLLTAAFTSLLLRAGPPASETPSPANSKVVYLGSGLSSEELLMLGSALGMGGSERVLLLDTPRDTVYLKAFLSAFRPNKVVPVGELPCRLDWPLAPALSIGPFGSCALWPEISRVVLCPAGPRALLLQSACLAGVLRVPLWIVHGEAEETAELAKALGDASLRQVYAVGGTASLCPDSPSLQVVSLADEPEVARAYLRELSRQGPIQSLVIANPDDVGEGRAGMSTLAPWVALQRRAALLLTNSAGDNVEDLVRTAVDCPELREVENVLLVADLTAIPMRRRPNPIPGDRDLTIDMEPLTPDDASPCSFATGRLFHQDLAVVPLLLARQRLLTEARGPRRALVASNPGGSLRLLETFSRATANELRNAGYQTTALFGRTIHPDELRQLLTEQDLFLWEGHHDTLIRHYAFPTWDEPLPPTLVVLQSCLALAEDKAQPLLERGAVGVVGASSRIYSGTGGAFSLAFCDAFLYDGQSVGGALRQAKNFLLAYALLKEKRLGPAAKLTGANIRSAWGFTLWGDPTLKLPEPLRPTDALAPVRHQAHGDTIVITLPEAFHESVDTARFQARLPPNARLAGLVTQEPEETEKTLVPVVFAEVALPQAPDGKTPRLHGRLPENHAVFCWDARRRVGYLLALPGSGRQELRFQVSWE